MDRRQNDTQLGYLTGKVEDFGAAFKDHLAADAQAFAKILEKLDKLEDKVSDKFATVETIFKVGKFVALVVAAIATLKWGSIPDLYHLFFG
jgi:hypothetical protein